jgi:adenosylcobinamide-phosphate synthase
VISVGGSLLAGLLAGMAGDRLLGDPARAHPVAAFGRAARALERRAWRPSRAAGAAYATTLVAGTAAAVFAVDRLLRRRPVARMALAALVFWATVGGRSLVRVALGLAEAVRRGDLEEARRIAPSLVGRDPTSLDGPELCRAAVESVAENTADAVVGPLLWGATLGPAGAAAYRAANTLDAIVGHPDGRYERFGWAAARLDDLLTWPAARLSAALAVVLAPLAGGSVQRAWRTLRRDGGAHPSPNAGRLEAAFAGALGVRLGGLNRYGDRIERRPPLGDGAPPGPDDVERAARLSELVGLAAAGVCAPLAWRARR